MSIEVTPDMHAAITSDREAGRTWAESAARYGVTWQALRAAYGRYAPAAMTRADNTMWRPERAPRTRQQQCARKAGRRASQASRRANRTR